VNGCRFGRATGREWPFLSFQPSNVELRGPSSEAPEGKEKNWIQTIPGKPWFVFFRLYGPTEAFFEREWILPDVEKAG
jgi:hypothetical protein